jgi:predicted SAM-dependent methyltransferase
MPSNPLAYALAGPKIVIYASSWIRARVLMRSSCVRIDIGSGARSGSDGWISVDQSLKSDLPWDLRRGIPYASRTVSEIYSSHLFEHLPFRSLKFLLAECYRVLKPTGTLRVAVPNARLYMQSYLEDKDFLATSSCIWQSGLCPTGSAIDQVNYIAYNGGDHKYMFDEENLVKILQQSGFQKVGPRPFDPKLDLRYRDFESIYAIATK